MEVGKIKSHIKTINNHNSLTLVKLCFCTMVRIAFGFFFSVTASTLAFLGFCYFVIIRSLLSKLVEKNELGKISSTSYFGILFP